MKIIYFIFLFSCLGIPLRTMAEEVILNDNFNSGLKNWHCHTIPNDEPANTGKIILSDDALKSKKSALLCTPKSKSWAYLVKSYKTNQFKGRKLRLTAWIKTNNYKRASILIMGGAIWGGAGGDNITANRLHPKGNYQWEKITVELDVNPAYKVYSIALGLDYHAEKSWLVVDDVKFECGDHLSPVIPEAPIPSDSMDSRLISMSEDLTVKLKSAKRLLQSQNQKENRKFIASKLRQLRKYRKLLTGNPSQVSSKKIKDFNAFINEINDQLNFSCLPVGSMQTFSSSKVLPLNKKFDAVNIHSAGNSHQNRIVLVRNNLDNVRWFKFELTGAIADKLELREMITIEGAPDSLPAFPSTRLLKVAPGETAGIWISFPTETMKPGKYQTTVKIIPLERDFNSVEIPFELNVYPVTLPAEMPIATFNFDYNAARDIRTLKFLRQYRINTFLLTKLGQLNQNPIDYSILEQMLSNLKTTMGNAPFRLFCEVWFVRAAKGWKPEFTPWLNSLSQFLNDHGIPNSDWYLHIYDETLKEEFYQAAKAVKQVNPHVQISSDHAGTPATIKKFAKVVDLWCPKARWNVGSNDWFHTMRQTGHPIWAYRCDSTPTLGVKGYREMGWIAWKNKLDGISFWTSIACAFKSKKKVNYGMNYVDYKGQFIPSRRMECWRSGLEDYLLLYLADQQATENPELKKLLDRAVVAVQAAAKNSPEKLEQQIEYWRQKLLSRMSSNR